MQTLYIPEDDTEANNIQDYLLFVFRSLKKHYGKNSKNYNNFNQVEFSDIPLPTEEITKEIGFQNFDRKGKRRATESEDIQESTSAKKARTDDQTLRDPNDSILNNVSLSVLDNQPVVPFQYTENNSSLDNPSTRTREAVAEIGCNPSTEDTAPINQTNDEKNDYYGILLSYASRRDKLGAVKLLIEFGADVNYDDGCGMTPLGIARNRGYENIERYLLEHGAREFGSDSDD